MPSRLPEPGTPAYTYLADQFDAAQRHATEQAAALLHAGARLVTPTGPWAAERLASALPTRRGRRGCRHLAAMTGPAPMYVTAPAWLVCHDCLPSHDDRARIPCAQCARATRPGPRRYGVCIAQRQLLIAYGALCFTCTYREHRPEGP